MMFAFPLAINKLQRINLLNYIRDEIFFKVK